ncbi:MAG: hypothetical protein Q9M23_04950, partial [Mariprofundaceae bacterium]|nr:hypothetical protein [Mariprofundaceae bacterium]
MSNKDMDDGFKPEETPEGAEVEVMPEEQVMDAAEAGVDEADVDDADIDEQLRGEVAETRDKMLRMHAEMDNLRK